jgi:hypothetical protein
MVELASSCVQITLYLISALGADTRLLSEVWTIFNSFFVYFVHHIGYHFLVLRHGMGLQYLLRICNILHISAPIAWKSIFIQPPSRTIHDTCNNVK